jgi:hypothetical protein
MSRRSAIIAGWLPASTVLLGSAAKMQMPTTKLAAVTAEMVLNILAPCIDNFLDWRED